MGGQSQFIEMFYNDNFICEKLKTHIEVIRGVSYKPTDVRDAKDKDSSVILRSNNIFNGLINYDDIVFVDSTRVSEAQELSKGDIVMCGSNGSKNLVGKAAMITELPLHKTSFGAFCLGIRCKDTIHPMYLSSYFQTSIYRNKIEELGTGSNILNIKPDYINNMEIPVPRIEQQLKFVSIAEQADKSKFVGFKSQFIEMFGTLDEPKVEVKRLIDVVLGSGQYGSNTSATDYQKGMPRYIRITDINDDGSLNDDIKTAEVIDDKYRLVSGDIVFARTGATVGKTYLHEAGDAIYAGYLIKYQMNSELMNPLFMKAFTHSKTYYNWVANSQKIGAQPNISATQYDQMPVLVPSVYDQDAFLKIYQQADKSKYNEYKS